VNFSQSNRTRWWICVGLLLAIAIVYGRVVGFDFVNFDDPDYVTANNAVKSGLTLHGLAWAFTHFYASNWHPLTWISHMLDCEIFGMHPGGHHSVNVALHAGNAIVLFWLLQRLTGAQWRSALVAGLFALHPLHVESVAWISERKDVLSTFFGLVSLLAYAEYVQAAKTKNPAQQRWFITALVLFALSLMAKPMLVTLPFLLLLLDVWPMQRVENAGWRTMASPQFGKLALEKWPWFALTAASCVITFAAQKAGGAVVSAEHFPFPWRVANAVISYFVYVLKACCPIHLAVFYPLPREVHGAVLLASAAFLVAASVVAMITLRRWPFMLVGWLWFVGTLIPVIGLVQVGNQALADRYTYFPLTGFFIAVVWGGAELLRRGKTAQIVGAAVSILVLVCCSILTVSQLQYWKNSLTLFTHALALTKDNAPANNNLGTALAALGQKQEALDHYAEAVRIEPNNARYRNNLATALAGAGQRDAALEQYQAVIGIDPGFAEAYSNIGALFLAERRVPEALTNLYQAVQIDPGNAELRSNLGNVLSMTGRLDDALAQHLEAVRLDPFSAVVRLNAGLALLKAGRANEASVQFAAAVRLNPTSAEARFELGRQLFLDRRFASALENLEAAVKLKPNYAVAQFYESAVLGELGRYDEATTIAAQALESAQRAGPTNLVARIHDALESYQARRPYRPQ